jgi:pimeloyl-ACP methyl ester carboxylesterase
MAKEILLRNTQPLMPEKLGFKTQYFDLPGVRLHAAVAGPESGKPVILLHGFPDFWAGWKRQIGPMAEAGYRVIVPDQRGYNLSDKPKGIFSYRLDLLEKDVIGLMDALGFPKSILVGHDWGGVVAWATAAQYPDRVERLAVLDAPYPPVVYRTMLTHPRQILKSWYIYFFQLPKLPEAILGRNNWKTLTTNLSRTTPEGTFSREDFDDYRKVWDQNNAMTSMLIWYRALVQRPVRLPLPPPLEMPVLLLWGGRDFALGRELAEASIRMCKNGELFVFENANHWIQQEQAQEVNQRLLAFFNR